MGATIVRRLAAETLSSDEASAVGLARLCFVLGHVALKLLVYSEVGLKRFVFGGCELLMLTKCWSDLGILVTEGNCYNMCRKSFELRCSKVFHIVRRLVLCTYDGRVINV